MFIVYYVKLVYGLLDMITGYVRLLI